MNTARQRIMLHLAFFLLITALSAVNGVVATNFSNLTYYNPPFEEVKQNNLGAGEKLMHFTENLGLVGEDEPPIIFADLRVLSVDPTVDSRISNLHIPDVLWGWGEGHMDKYEYGEDDSCCGADYKRKTVLESNGPPELKEAVMTFEFNGMSREVGAVYKKYSFDNGTAIENLSGLGLAEEEIEDIENGNIPENLSIHVEYLAENPITVPFTKEELDINPDKNTGDVPGLNIKLAGRIDFPYIKKEYYKDEKWDNGTCSCESESDEHGITISRELVDERAYSVDNHNVTFMLKTPITREITYVEPNIEYLLFTNRYPQKFIFFTERTPTSIYYAYNYRVNVDAFGIAEISPLPSGLDTFPPNGLDSDLIGAGAQPVDIHVKTEYGQKRHYYIEPYQIENTSEAYGILYSIKTSYNKSLNGPRAIGIVFYDLFGDPFISEADTVYFRIPLKCDYNIRESNVEFTLTDDTGKPISGYPATITLGNQTASAITSQDGKIIVHRAGKVAISAPSNDYYRGCESEVESYSVATGARNICFPVSIIIVVLFALSYRITGRALPFNKKEK